MAAHHCYCTEFSWCRPLMTDTHEDTLWICLNRIRPRVIVPGTEALFCYWKIAFYLEIPKRRVDLYVPPEWRTIQPAVLDEWVGKLRDNPYEDIILGATLYKWLPDALVPVGQRLSDIPMAGRNGWPESQDETPFWGEPRLQYSDGTDLPVRINRQVPHNIVNGMEKIFCYWKIELPDAHGRKFDLWVPPEWRRLSKGGRALYTALLCENMYQPITLGGVRYIWRGDSLLPEGQLVEIMESQGYGLFNYHPPEDTDEDEDVDTLVPSTPYETAPGSGDEDPAVGGTNTVQSNLPLLTEKDVFEEVCRKLCPHVEEGSETPEHGNLLETLV